ncbi:hypothetical protein [Sporomusa acidovorans]|uniref:Uncharacterized protein n=1 Tax=Sporomusa acidovorans (strain ATCC 49682 / DSM 3132 / Mol) TaxID=1123286 RepID=A0ABZ3IXZ9_SPOA4|nr:hypothetical protein [Sporomusa acidovorans]OZC22377.1 hypothetical protein SPACI_14260 [Sporomusa acidovorans DSM 3132]SDE47379.1 hypothetical protein SAMN04488499_101450 [Sporomusa acidovorans]
MKKFANRLLNCIFSLITTGLIMAAPVAAMVYASEAPEPVAVFDGFSVKASTITYNASGEANIIQYSDRVDKKDNAFHDLLQLDK